MPKNIENDVLSLLTSLRTENNLSPLTEYLDKNQVAYLDLNHAKLLEVDVKNLCRALAKNKTVTCLYLSSTNLNSKSAQIIAQTIQKNHNIIRVDLSHNNIDSCAALSIKLAIMENPSLYYLDLSDNRLKDAGVSLLIEGIANSEHKSMQRFSLNLNNNQCTPLKEETLERDLQEAYRIQRENFAMTEETIQPHKPALTYKFSKELGKLTLGAIALATSACYAYSQFKK